MKVLGYLGLTLLMRIFFLYLNEKFEFFERLGLDEYRYAIYQDASKLMMKKANPYLEINYRYHIFYSFFTMLDINYANKIKIDFGKIFFIFIDCIIGALIFLCLKQKNKEEDYALKLSFLWLLNPISIWDSIIGNGNCIIALLIILLIIFMHKNCIIISSIILGIAIHFQFLMIIYILPVYLFYSGYSVKKKVQKIVILVKLIFPLLFVFISIFILLINFFGYEYFINIITKSLEFKLNFSIFNYIMYLSYDLNYYETFLIISFLFIVVLITLCSFKLKDDPSFCFTIITFIFISFYYQSSLEHLNILCAILPIGISHISFNKKEAFLIIISEAIALFLHFKQTYFIEYQGKQYFRLIYVTSVLLFIIHSSTTIYLLREYNIDEKNMDSNAVKKEEIQPIKQKTE